MLLLWVGYGYWQFRGSLDDANERVDARTRAALTPGGSLLSDASTTLVLGSDRRPDGGAGALRLDPARARRPGRATASRELSIPRDLRVTIPGHGDDRINAAYTLGGPALAIQTVRALTGIPINHVVLVDFSGFRELVDALGGRDDRQPRRRSSRTASTATPGASGAAACTSTAATRSPTRACARTPPTPSDNDLTRGLRQQRVLQAIAQRPGLARARCCTCRASAARSASRSRPTSRPTT